MQVPEAQLIQENISEYLRRYSEKELLRFVAIGSVDDGKSTLIGRLLHDTGMVYEDHLAAVKRATSLEGEDIDFSLFTDGLKAEREQGITIDVAYRYFSTEKRKFIIADTPGHVQYTRNMVTGASTADLALILIDARLGVLQQSRRHAYIASLVGIPNLAVCINKMDLVGYDRGVYDRIRKDFDSFAFDLSFDSVEYFPVSALKSDNLVELSPKTPWYQGKTVLEHLETVPTNPGGKSKSFRMPIQSVIRPSLHYRGFAGQIATGHIEVGDEIMVLPAKTTSRIASVDLFGQDLKQASAPKSVSLTFEDEIDASRGDMVIGATELPKINRNISANLVWMSDSPLDLEKTYILKHTTQNIRAQVERIEWVKNLDTLEEEQGAPNLQLNDIGFVKIACHRALYFDDYKNDRILGAFILIDSLSNNTVAAGMIADSKSETDIDSELLGGSAIDPKTQVSGKERSERMGQRGVTIWLSGRPGSGRWTLAYALERRLFDLGRTATVIDPSNEDLRSMISAARACTSAGLVTICAFPTYTRQEQEVMEEALGETLIHVHINTSKEICIARRPSYAELEFEAPPKPNLTMALDSLPLKEAVKTLVETIDSIRE